jgi:hypothetical protein
MSFNSRIGNASTGFFLNSRRKFLDGLNAGKTVKEIFFNAMLIFAGMISIPLNWSL